MTSTVSKWLSNFTTGCTDSLTFSALNQFLLKSDKLRTLFWQFFVLNFVVLCGSLFVFQYVGERIVQLLHTWTKSPEAAPLFTAGFTVLFKYAWMWPVRILAHILNSVWCFHVVGEATRLQKAAQFSAMSYDRILRSVTECIYQVVLLFFFYLEVNLWSLVPYVGFPISFVFSCWLHAFYAFDYRWAHEGRSLKQRVKAFELSWDYYFGFGAPMTLLYFVLCWAATEGPFIAFAVSSLLFPIHIIVALTMPDRPLEEGQWQMNVFSHFAMRCVDLLWLMKRKCQPPGKPKTKRRMMEQDDD
mmetsp:Transcript_4018/g.7145  ORF Transcript_4018/g.7145 Transcript_4018/m.7145 type:complete len:301 (-) Transcript_4018:1329-2231(-)